MYVYVHVGLRYTCLQSIYLFKNICIQLKQTKKVVLFFFYFILNNILSLEKKYTKKFLGAFLGYLFLSSQHHLLVILSFKNHCWFCIFKSMYKFRKGFLTAVIHRNCIVRRQIFITLAAVKQYGSMASIKMGNVNS